MQWKWAIGIPLLILIVGCTAGIRRSGYDVKNLNPSVAPSECAIAIKKKFDFSDYDVEILGEIESINSGFNLDCTEEIIFSIFLRDACALGSHAINIIEEKERGFYDRSCYEAKAQLVRINDQELAASISSDVLYLPFYIIQRSLPGRYRNQQIRESMAIGLGVHLGGIMVK